MRRCPLGLAYSTQSCIVAVHATGFPVFFSRLNNNLLYIHICVQRHTYVLYFREVNVIC